MGDETRRLRLPNVPRGADSYTLRFRGVRHRPESFNVRVFVGEPEADAATGLEANPAFAGNVAMYGHGAAAFGAEQFDPQAAGVGVPPAAATTTLPPFETLLDVTGPVRAAGTAADVVVTLVVVGPDGEPLPASAFQFEEAVLEPRRAPSSPPGR
jgi:hypothetical protein